MQAIPIPQTLELFQAAILRKLGAEVDLIFQYGSQVRGNTHKYSDLDISYVPVHEETWDCITVMVADQLIDLYPMHWSKLENMAEYRDVSSTVLLQNKVIYWRDEAVLERFRSLGEHLKTKLEPGARSEMVRRALEIFQRTAYPYYLLKQSSRANHLLGCIQQSLSILRTVLHCLAVCNQSLVDTRKLEQVLALPRLPEGFSETANRILSAVQPGKLLSTCETLMHTTREFLLQEQRQVLIQQAPFSEIFDAAYPELKRDLQQILLGCERGDLLSVRTSLVSLYHELSLGIAQGETGIRYSSFNSLLEYEVNFVALGFPALLPHLKANDLGGLQSSCLVFDRRLREYLAEKSVGLNNFSSFEDLKNYLDAPSVT